MGVFAIVAGLMVAHAPLPPYEEVSERELVGAIQATWSLDIAKATTLAKGAKLGGQLGGIHPAWLLSMAHFESRFNFGARGDCKDRRRKKTCKAFGLCQIHYHTGKSVLKGLTRQALLNPIINLAVAGLLYRRYIHKYGRRRAHVIYASGNRCPKCTTTPTFNKRYRLMKKVIRNIKGTK